MSFVARQVLAARDKVPHEYYKYFLDSLLDTVREGIAECSEVGSSGGKRRMMCL